MLPHSIPVICCRNVFQHFRYEGILISKRTGPGTILFGKSPLLAAAFFAPESPAQVVDADAHPLGDLGCPEFFQGFPNWLAGPHSISTHRAPCEQLPNNDVADLFPGVFTRQPLALDQPTP